MLVPNTELGNWSVKDSGKRKKKKKENRKKWSNKKNNLL